MIKFYDTCALLHLREKAFDAPFVIAVQTLRELEQIKVSRHKDAAVKYAARRVTRLLDEHPEMFTVTFHSVAEDLNHFYDSTGADAEICYNAFRYNRDQAPIEFVTDDVSCRCIAREIYGLHTSSAQQDDEIYRGYISVTGSSEAINE